MFYPTYNPPSIAATPVRIGQALVRREDGAMAQQSQGVEPSGYVIVVSREDEAL